MFTVAVAISFFLASLTDIFNITEAIAYGLPCVGFMFCLEMALGGIGSDDHPSKEEIRDLSTWDRPIQRDHAWRNLRERE